MKGGAGRRYSLALVIGFAGLVAGCGGGHGSQSATTTTGATPTYTAAPKQPVPCATPSSGGAATTSAAATPGTTTWTGVFEKVLVNLDQSGALKGIPQQHTRVSAIGNAPVTVAVPVTATRLHKKDRGSRPQAVDQRAQITLDPNGTAVQEVHSSFNDSLPVTVAVTYTLDGKPVSDKHIGRKSGTLGIQYKLTNTSSQLVSACFEGFNGKQQHLTVSTPLPLVASLSLTVPSEATSFEAPGASLSSARKGVSVGWTESLFEPLGPTTQTFSLSMKMTHVSIPKVTLYVLTVDPRVLAGSAPAKSAVAVGKAKAEQARIVASVQQELDAMQKRVSSLSAAPPPAAPHPKPATKRSRRLASADEAGAVSSSFPDLNASIAALVKLHVELSHKTAAALVLAARVRTDAAAVTTQLHELSAQLAGPVQNALLEVQQLGQLQTDLGAVSPNLKSTPAYEKLASDLQVAQSTATRLQSSLEGVQQRMQSASAGLGTLESDLNSLKAAAAATGTLARDRAGADITTIEAQLKSAEASYAAAKASLAKTVAAQKAEVNKAVARKEAALHRKAAVQIAAARKALAKDKATRRATSATDAQLALQSVKASLAALETQMTTTEGQIADGLATANADYARILALNELAVLNQLPGGSASGVTTQNGRFVYSIG